MLSRVWAMAAYCSRSTSEGLSRRRMIKAPKVEATVAATTRAPQQRYTRERDRGDRREDEERLKDMHEQCAQRQPMMKFVSSEWAEAQT
jgi:hypothetical protein